MLLRQIKSDAFKFCIKFPPKKDVDINKRNVKDEKAITFMIALQLITTAGNMKNKTIKVKKRMRREILYLYIVKVSAFYIKKRIQYVLLTLKITIQYTWELS